MHHRRHHHRRHRHQKDHQCPTLPGQQPGEIDFSEFRALAVSPQEEQPISPRLPTAITTTEELLQRGAAVEEVEHPLARMQSAMADIPGDVPSFFDQDDQYLNVEHQRLAQNKKNPNASSDNCCRSRHWSDCLITNNNTSHDVDSSVAVSPSSTTQNPRTSGVPIPGSGGSMLNRESIPQIANDATVNRRGGQEEQSLGTGGIGHLPDREHGECMYGPMATHSEAELPSSCSTENDVNHNDFPMVVEDGFDEQAGKSKARNKQTIERKGSKNKKKITSKKNLPPREKASALTRKSPTSKSKKPSSSVLDAVTD